MGGKEFCLMLNKKVHFNFKYLRFSKLLNTLLWEIYYVKGRKARSENIYQLGIHLNNSKPLTLHCKLGLFLSVILLIFDLSKHNL